MRIFLLIIASVLWISCSKKDSSTGRLNPQPPETFTLAAASVNGADINIMRRGIGLQQPVRLQFTAPVKRSTTNAILLNTSSGTSAAYSITYQNGDSVLIVEPSAKLQPLTRYNLTVSSALQSVRGTSLSTTTTGSFITAIDSSNKFPIISDTALVELVQRQTFKYFWDFAHPVSGMARERNTSGDLVTSGGSGFGVMAIIVGVHRGFITRAQGLSQVQKIVGFLKNTAQRFHGAFPHWLNGINGMVIPFSARDNGADLVETSFLIQGLLCARQFFAGANQTEVDLRTDINTLWREVEWSWFRKNSENVLYWH